jgi:hypothetical protein
MDAEERSNTYITEKYRMAEMDEPKQSKYVVGATPPPLPYPLCYHAAMHRTIKTSQMNLSAAQLNGGLHPTGYNIWRGQNLSVLEAAVPIKAELRK